MRRGCAASLGFCLAKSNVCGYAYEDCHQLTLCTECKTQNDEKILQMLLKFHKQAGDEQHVVRFFSSSSDEKTATLSTQFRMARDPTRKDRTVGDKSNAGKPTWKTKLQSRHWDLGPRADPKVSTECGQSRNAMKFGSRRRFCRRTLTISSVRSWHCEAQTEQVRNAGPE